jgi:cytidylate kinase
MPKIITIDGPAGSGKSTIAREVAKRLGFTYLDTGAMYRAFTLKAIKVNIDLEDSKGLIELIKKTKIDIIALKDGSLKVFLDKEDVTLEIRKPVVTQKVSFIARIPGIRAEMVKLQREFGEKNDIVVEGRDIGTVVFPQAYKKFYLDADFKERVRRRMGDFEALGQKISPQEVEYDLKQRDTADMTRKVGPLIQAKDAIYLDTTRLSIEQTFEKVISYIK